MLQAYHEAKEAERVAKRKEAEQRGVATKARQERDAAKKTVQELKDAEIERIRQAEKAYEDAEDDNHKLLLQASAHFSGICRTLDSLIEADLTQANQDRLIGELERMFAMIAQRGGRVREDFGVGLNEPPPVNQMYLDSLPAGRDTVVELSIPEK